MLFSLFQLVPKDVDLFGELENDEQKGDYLCKRLIYQLEEWPEVVVICLCRDTVVVDPADEHPRKEHQIDQVRLHDKTLSFDAFEQLQVLFEFTHVDVVEKGQDEST